MHSQLIILSFSDGRQSRTPPLLSLSNRAPSPARPKTITRREGICTCKYTCVHLVIYWSVNACKFLYLLAAQVCFGCMFVGDSTRSLKFLPGVRTSGSGHDSRVSAVICF